MAIVTKVLIVDYQELPEELKDTIRSFDGFGNGQIIEYMSYMSYMSPGEETWDETLTVSEIESYWKTECSAGSRNETLEQFINNSGLKFDGWLLEQQFDLNVSKILVDVYW